MDDITAALRSLLELGAPAIYLFFLVTVWRQYLQTIQLLVEALREKRVNKPNDTPSAEL